MSGYERCPLCGADLRDLDAAGEDKGCLRTIGVCVQGVYDGVLYWLCPDCGGAWHRWTPESGWRYRRADELIAAHNDARRWQVRDEAHSHTAAQLDEAFGSAP